MCWLGQGPGWSCAAPRASQRPPGTRGPGPVPLTAEAHAQSPGGPTGAGGVPHTGPPTLGRLHMALNQGGEPSRAGASVWGPLGKMKISSVSCHVGLDLGLCGQVLRTLPLPPRGAAELPRQRPRQLHGEEVLPPEPAGTHGFSQQRVESRALSGVGAQPGCPCSALWEHQRDVAHGLLLPTPGCPPVPRHTDVGKSGWARVSAALCPERPCHLASEAASS